MLCFEQQKKALAAKDWFMEPKSIWLEAWRYMEGQVHVESLSSHNMGTPEVFVSIDAGVQDYLGNYWRSIGFLPKLLWWAFNSPLCAFCFWQCCASLWNIRTPEKRWERPGDMCQLSGVHFWSCHQIDSYQGHSMQLWKCGVTGSYWRMYLKSILRFYGSRKMTDGFQS